MIIRFSICLSAYLRIIRWIVLYNPVDVGNVEASGRYVRTEENPGSCVAILEEGRRSLCLLLLTLMNYIRSKSLIVKL